MFPLPEVFCKIAGMPQGDWVLASTVLAVSRRMASSFRSVAGEDGSCSIELSETCRNTISETK